MPLPPAARTSGNSAPCTHVASCQATFPSSETFTATTRVIIVTVVFEGTLSIVNVLHHSMPLMAMTVNFNLLFFIRELFSMNITEVISF
jgi:hypothetical protein